MILYFFFYIKVDNPERPKEKGKNEPRDKRHGVRGVNYKGSLIYLACK